MRVEHGERKFDIRIAQRHGGVERRMRGSVVAWIQKSVEARMHVEARMRVEA